MITVRASTRAAILRVLGVVLRIAVGVPLVCVTGYISALSIDFAIAEPRLWDRVVAGFSSVVFALMAFAVCKILVFRIPRRTFRVSWPPSEGPGFSDALVPASPKPKLPTLSAAAKFPKKGLA